MINVCSRQSQNRVPSPILYIFSALSVICFAIFVDYSTVQAGPWDNVDKDVAATALGHKTAVSCHNCYNGPGNKIYNIDQANEKVGRAVDRGADLIELDLSDSGDDEPICVTHKNIKPCENKEPLLEQMLNYSTLKNSDAMLFLEIKSPKSSDVHMFARKLFNLILNQGNPVYAREGRPLFIRSFNARYLNDIRDELFDNDNYVELRNHVRFSVLFSEKKVNEEKEDVYWGGTGSIKDLQNKIRTEVYDRDFDMVELDYRMKDILGALKYAEHLGLATGIYTIPRDYGEVFIAAMREEVDQVTSEYRVNYARNVISAVNTLAYANIWCCHPHYAVYHYDYSGGSGTIWEPFFQEPTLNSHGTPGIFWDDRGQDRFGYSLDFRTNQGYISRSLSMGDRDNDTPAGFLVTAYVNFDRLSNLPEGTMAILNKSESGGFALELHQSESRVYLRFGVHVNGRYRYHSYNVGDTNVCEKNDQLNGADGYFLIGAYDGNGGIYLWIDNRKHGFGGSYYGGVTRNGASIMAGADPQPSAALKARYFFDGLIQQVSVQQWDDHPADTN